MADLKEETTLDNNEENQVEETVERKRPIDPNLHGIQLYYEQNKKMITYAGGGLIAIYQNKKRKRLTKFSGLRRSFRKIVLTLL
jgi:hypothetical protein